MFFNWKENNVCNLHLWIIYYLPAKDKHLKITEYSEHEHLKYEKACPGPSSYKGIFML